MEIKINGQNRHFEGPVSVAALVTTLALEPRKIAIERNLAIVPKSAYAVTLLADGDQIEIVQFVGGG